MFCILQKELGIAEDSDDESEEAASAARAQLDSITKSLEINEGELSKHKVKLGFLEVI